MNRNMPSRRYNTIPDIATLRKYLERHKLDAAEVLAVLLQTMMAEHLLLYRRLDGGLLPDAVVDAIEAAEEEAEKNCEHPPAVTILESALAALRRYEPDQPTREMRELSLATPAADQLWWLIDQVRELLALCTDKANQMHKEDQPGEHREAA